MIAVAMCARKAIKVFILLEKSEKKVLFSPSHFHYKRKPSNMSTNTRSPVPVASTSTDTVQSHQSSAMGTGASGFGYQDANTGTNEYISKKAELAKLSEDEIRIVQLFRPGAIRDPSYRRVALSAIEYMKDVKEQMIDEIRHQPDYAMEPPDTDAEQLNSVHYYMDGKRQKVPRRKIDQAFLFRASPDSVVASPITGDDSTGTSPSDSTGNPHRHFNSDHAISDYDELIRIASDPARHRRATVNKLKALGLEPLFQRLRRIESKPSVFTELQDVMKFIRGLEPPAPPRRSTTSVTQTSSPPTSMVETHFSISMRRRILEESNISANELSDQHRQQWSIWERNLIWFVHTANTLVGTFHGHLPYHWLNPDYLNREWRDGPEVKKLPRIPTLEEFDRSRYSISAFPRIKYGIKVIGKEVSLQVLSLTDFRYRIEDMNQAENHVMWNYYRDSILKLSKLIPNKRSFDVAIDVGMIPEDMKSMVDFTWWTTNVIKFGRDVERSIKVFDSNNSGISVGNSSGAGGAGIVIGKDTYDLFDDLHKEYYSFVKTVRRDTGEQLKYNPVQFILNIIMAILTLAGVVFAITGIIQVLQGFCAFGDQYC
ncbi:hypothetical protein BDB00DRAFT_813765 [Zychaea mexicana]|uniref:uncharacterized protein n=1 Tax=Zychaea mexicana TaxID=64656 RepID=UPI0022FE01F3|nr:uncharacterized protein BDB00DRAFT_813765 [Zychaea mexicana]KAI9495544.1 hypothetical protein BDB00DRAFT_813765 [Zychaea mexicana]